MIILLYLNILFAFILLFFKKIKGQKYVYFSFLLGVFTWSFSLYLLVETENFNLNNLVLIGGLISILSLNASLDKSILNRKNLFLILLISIFSITNLIIEDILVIDNVIVPVRGPAYPLYAFSIIFFAIGSIRSMYFLIKKANPIEKNKIFFLLLGVSIMLFVSLFSNLVLPWLGVNKFQLLGPISVIIFIFFSCYAIFVKKLIDVKLVVQKSIIYIIIFAFVTILYVFSLHTILGHITNTQPHFIATIFIIFISIKTIPLIDRWLRMKTDPWLFGKKINEPLLLKNISKVIIDVQDIEEFIHIISKELKSSLRVKEVCLSIADKRVSPLSVEYIFAQDNKKVYVPVLDKKELIATLYVGSKKSGESFTFQDVYLLSILSYQVLNKLKQVQLISELKQQSKFLKESLDDSEEEIEHMYKNQNSMIIDIAHNLQTPLTILKGELNSLEKMKHVLETKDLKSFNQSIDRLSQFITRLLQAADIREDIFTFKKVDMSEYLTDMCEYFEVIAQAQDITFTTSIASNLHGNIDPKYMKDAIANVVSNAFKYKASRKEHKVSLSLREKNNSLFMSISDTGIGIAKKEIPHVFTRWYQSDRTKKGSGLGLAIANNIVKKHGGTMQILSEKGTGTSVEIILPMVT